MPLSLLCPCEWVASCTGCGTEGPYRVKNRQNPRGRRHTPHQLPHSLTPQSLTHSLTTCGQFKKKPRLVPFRPPASFFTSVMDEGGDCDTRRMSKGVSKGVSKRRVDSLSVGMFVVYTTNDEEKKVARVAESDVGALECVVDPMCVFGNLLIRYKHEPRVSLSLDQVAAVMAPSAVWQTDYPANVVTIITARNNICMYYTSSAVRMSEGLAAQLKKAHNYKRLRTAESVIQAFLHTDHPDNKLQPSQRVTLRVSDVSPADIGGFTSPVSHILPPLPLPPSHDSTTVSEGIAIHVHDSNSHECSSEGGSDESTEGVGMWVADCTGCGKEGEYKVTRCATGGDRYKRHNVTSERVSASVNKTTTYCGLFRENARLYSSSGTLITADTTTNDAAEGMSSRNHSVTHSRESSPHGSKKLRACVYIKKMSSSVASWQFPLQLSSEDQPLLQCVVCDKVCKNKQVLSTHMTRVHGRRRSGVGVVGGVLGALGGSTTTVTSPSTVNGSSTVCVSECVSEDLAGESRDDAREGGSNAVPSVCRSGGDSGSDIDSGNMSYINSHKRRNRFLLTPKEHREVDECVSDVVDGAVHRSMRNLSEGMVWQGSSTVSPRDVEDSTTARVVIGHIGTTAVKKRKSEVVESCSGYGSGTATARKGSSVSREKLSTSTDVWRAGCSVCGVIGIYLQRHLVVTSVSEGVAQCGCFTVNPAKESVTTTVIGSKRVSDRVDTRPSKLSRDA